MTKGDINPRGVGIGLRHSYKDELAQNVPSEIDFFEIHPENYINLGGKSLAVFEQLRQERPFVSHGLTLSLGSTDELNWDFLKQLKTFLHRYEFPWFTDHLCFTSINGAQTHDLLPLPFTQEAALHVAERARIVQDYLNMPLGLENVSFYFHPDVPQMSEAEFINLVLEKSGCSLLLDINNIYVNAVNHNSSAEDSVAALINKPVLHMHIAGHNDQKEDFIIDTHGEAICDPVWELLAYAKSLRPNMPPVLIERDNNLPPLSELLDEVMRAKEIV